MKRTALIIILAVVCLVVGLSSYRIGRDRALAVSASNKVATGKAEQSTDTLAEPVESRPPAELVSLKQKLKHSYATCPSAQYDWILRGQTAAILATMTTAELKTLYDELLAGDKKGRGVRMDDPSAMLALDVLRELGRKDPVAACTVPDNGSLLDGGRIAAFRDWQLRDPRAVERWMNSVGDVVPASLRRAWLSERVKSDPYNAVQQLSKLTPEQREASLAEWSTSLALLPGERKALLDAVREDPAMLKKCAGQIAGALADRSVEEAYQFVDSLELDEEMASSLDDGIFVKWAMSDPQVAFAEWAKQQQTRLPENFFRVLDNWSLNSPGTEQAIKWLDTVEPGPVKEQIQVHFIEDLTTSERFEQAVRMGMSMDNREEGKRQAVRAIATWKEKFPEHAKERMAAILKEKGVDVR